MTSLVNDTLARQIQRGEVFYGALANLNTFDEGDLVKYTIEVGANDCAVSFDVSVNGTFSFVLLSGVTLSSGTPITLRNMNDASANTISVVVDHTATYTGGTTLFTSYLFNGVIPTTNPLNIPNGAFILEANTDYAIAVRNLDRDSMDIAVNFFLREL